jgi:hypothetical protein
MVTLAKRLKVSPKIYVRDCYDQIWQMFLEYENVQQELQINHPDRIAHAYLSGTPGIGKTAFMPYLIDRLLKDKRKVIFGSRDIDGFICWESKDKYHFIGENDIGPYLWDPSYFFLMDSRGIKSTLGPCIICSSPRADIAEQFRKTAKELFMPVWEWHEIQWLHSELYSDIITKDRLASRFYLLGGVPRYLFQHTDKNAATILKHAIDGSQPSHFQRLYESQGSAAQEGVSHRLIHQDSISEISLKYSSPYVATLVAEKYQAIRRDMVIQWLNETSDIGKAGGLRGYLFEDIGHSILLKGGVFRIRALDNNGYAGQKTIPAKELDIVADSMDTLGTKVWTDQSYFKPLSKIFECIDSWMVINGETWGFQFTVSKSHKISTALYWLFENMNLRHYVTVVYDEDKFQEYAKANLTPSKKAPFSGMKVPNGFNVKQYVMIISGNSAINLTDLWSIKKAEFLKFVAQPWTAETQTEYEAAFQ